MTTDVTLTSLVLNPWDGTFATGDKIALSYADLDYTPSASDPLKSTSGDVFKVYIGGVRIYRSSDQEYASGSGFLEDGDVSGQTLNGQSAAWTATSDNVWTIETASQRILLDKSEVEATSLYGSSGLNISITSGVIIELRRAVQDLKTTAVDFSNASILTEQDLDNSAKNVFHVAQQAVISTENAMLYDSGSDTYKATQPGTSTAKRISNVATPSSANDAANKAYVDGGSDVQTVAGLSTQIGLLGTSAMATATTGHIPVLANVVEQTVNYTVTVASSKFNIQGGEYGTATETPALTLIRGYTYVFDTSDSTVATHPLVFKNGSTTLGTSDGVTTDSASPGSTGAKVTVVVSDSVTITKYSCSTHGDDMGNTITLRHDDFKEIADNNTNVTTVAGQISPTNNVATVAGASANIGIVAGQISPTNNINTVAGLNTEIGQVAGKSTEIDVLVNKYDGSTTATSGTNKNITQVDTVADAIANVNSVATNISQVTTFSDTYHTAGSTEPSGSNVTEGDLWFDTANDVLKVYDGSSWGSASSSIATVASQNEFSASNGQGTGNKYFAVNHDVGLELVFLNGVRLKRGSDYYCTNSNTSTTPIASGNAATFVRLETVPGSSDILSVMAFGQIANNLAVNVSGGTFTGGVTFEAGTTHNTGSNTFTLPTTRGTDNQVLSITGSSGATTWSDTLSGPSITGIKYSNQTSGTFVENSGQTATDPNGGDLCQLVGLNFDSTLGGSTANVGISIDGTSATEIVVNSGKTEVTFKPPAKSAGSYTLTATNGSGLNATTTISYDANPTWVTGANADLGDFVDGSITGTNGPQIIASEDGSNLTTGYKQVTSNSDNTVITSGVAGLTIGDNGYLTGTLAGTNGATNSFYAVAHDNEGQQSAIRLFHFISYDYPGSGGTVVEPASYTGNYRSHTFLSGTANFTLYAATTVDILVVAGGGSGGFSKTGYGGGGGGAGGVIVATGKSLPAGTYSVVVGAGGITTAYGNYDGDQGNDSYFGYVDGTLNTATELKAFGGGGGNGGTTIYNGETSQGTQAYGAGRPGGSGGGGEQNGSTSASTQTSHNGGTGYGNIGGAGTSGSTGGGGGAGEAGESPGTNARGAGGDGIQNNFRTGTNVYYAGGGGGGVAGGSGNGASGGQGGGGTGGNDQGSSGTAASANTGGGGGGRGHYNLGTGTGGAGGSGIVVIRYAV